MRSSLCEVPKRFSPYACTTAVTRASKALPGASCGHRGKGDHAHALLANTASGNTLPGKHARSDACGGGILPSARYRGVRLPPYERLPRRLRAAVRETGLSPTNTVPSHRMLTNAMGPGPGCTTASGRFGGGSFAKTRAGDSLEELRMQPPADRLQPRRPIEMGARSWTRRPPAPLPFPENLSNR